MNQLATIPEKRPNGCPPGEGAVVLPNGSRIGNPAYVPTDSDRELVAKLSETVPASMIAEVLGIAQSTLYKHYRAEIAQARVKLTREFGDTVIGKCRNGDNDMLKFFLKTMGGWNETKVHEHTGAGGGPITHVDVGQLAAVFAGMNDNERAIAKRILSLVAASGPAPGPDSGGGSPEGSGGC